MKFIKTLIEDGIINAAQGRAIELFGLATLASLATGVLDNLETIINGGSVDWRAFLIAFGTTVSVAIIAGIKKYIRDIVADVK